LELAIFSITQDLIDDTTTSPNLGKLPHGPVKKSSLVDGSISPRGSVARPVGKSSLGNSTIYSTPPHKTITERAIEYALNIPYTQNSRKLRYHRLDIASDLLPNERVAKCSKYPVPDGHDYVEINHDGKGNATYGHLTVCGSVWACPVCSARINMERREELRAAIDAAHAKGWFTYLVTPTLKHKLESELTGLLDVLSGAWGKVKSGSPWVKARKKYGIEGYITGLEGTWGFSNGWHPHKHALLMFDHKLTEEEFKAFGDWLKARYVTMVKRLGGDASLVYGLDIREGKAAVDYVTKFGLDAELTGNEMGKGAHGLTPFQLLDLYEQGEAWAGELFREYAEAFKGRRQLVWSRGLRETLGLGEEVTDQESAEQEEQEESMETLMTLTGYQFGQVCKLRLRAQLLEVVAISGDAEIVWTWLKSKGVKLRRPREDLERLKALERLKHSTGEYHEKDKS